MQTRDTDQKATAILIMNNEIIQSAAKEVLEEKGFNVFDDVESCVDAAVGFIGAYFAILGILKHVRSINPALPIVLIQSDNFLLDRDFESYSDFYDVITLEDINEATIKKKFLRWFSEGRGRFLAPAYKKEKECCAIRTT